MINKDIMAIFEGLQIAKNSSEIKFPARTTFAIVRNLKMIEPIVDAIIESKNKVLQQYGIPDKDNPNTYYIPPENRIIVSQQLESIDNIENNLNLCKIKWSDIENLSLSIQIMEALYQMIEEED